jgi:homoserine O-acetyltransferase/O-succinyltransferase
MKTFTFDQPFYLEGGSLLPGIEIGYHTYGTLNDAKDNVVWVCHALTASSDVLDWWPGLFGEGALFNPEEHFIVCANNLGSCYGTTGPLNVNPHTGQPWFSYFPPLSIRDLVKAHDLLRRHLGIETISLLIGGSQGGQQVLEWNLLRPGLVEKNVVIACNAQHSAWGIAFNESQRMAIKADRTYYANTPNGGEKGLAAARSIALLSYRNYRTYRDTQTEQDPDKQPDLRPASYQRYQGEKLVKRFNAYSYLVLTQAMDSHHLGRGRSSNKEALKSIKAQTLVIGIRSDLLFPPAEQDFIAAYLHDSTLRFIDSLYGHDGFLIETKQLSRVISEFLEPTENKSSFTLKKNKLYA